MNGGVNEITWKVMMRIAARSDNKEQKRRPRTPRSPLVRQPRKVADGVGLELNLIELIPRARRDGEVRRCRSRDSGPGTCDAVRLEKSATLPTQDQFASCGRYRKADRAIGVKAGSTLSGVIDSHSFCGC